MIPSQIAVLSLFLVGGVAVLASYGYLIYKNRLTKQDLWFGISKPVQYVYYAVMVCAAIGFCAFTSWYCFSDSTPTRGLLSNSWVAPILYAVILGGSALWSFAVSQPSPTSTSQTVVVSSSLVAVAISTILLFAGAIEAETKTWYAALGLLLFATCTVLGDGIGWNANYLLHVKSSRSQESTSMLQVR